MTDDTALSLQDRYSPNGRCFGCGPANERGLRIKSRACGDHTEATWQPEPHHEAFPGMLSGGITGTLLDCHSNWTAAWHLMRQAVHRNCGFPCAPQASYPDSGPRAAARARSRIERRPCRGGGRARGRRQNHRHLPRHLRGGQGRSPGLPPLVMAARSSEQLHLLVPSRAALTGLA